MQRKKVFISSVQSEFATERQLLFEYLNSDALLGKFFEPFIFENVPALSVHPSMVFLKEVEKCDIYLGILGQQYGYEDSEGISPTEREFDAATKGNKTRLLFVKQTEKQHPKEEILVRKAENVIVRRSFSTPEQLKTAVYASLINYLIENEIIRTTPFDATLHPEATFEDLSEEKMHTFVGVAHRKRAFPFTEDSDMKDVLTHLNLMKGERITNAALLLFGLKPQRFFITSEVRCAHFHGLNKVKPIPSYQVYKGDVFEMIEQAVDFVLSKINLYVGDRSKSVHVDVEYEIPKQVVTEAIVNAVCHRDYTSNGSVQIMLFADRLEIANPGKLPYELSIEQLYIAHRSIPANPLIAEAMYLNGTIERMGTGTEEMTRLCLEKGIGKPEFIQELDFLTVVKRKTLQKIRQNEDMENNGISVFAEQFSDKHPTSTRQVPDKYPTSISKIETETESKEEIRRVVMVLNKERSRSDIQNLLGLKNRENFVLNYINPAIKQGFVAMQFPQNPNHPKQRYLLTAKGIKLKNSDNLLKTYDE